MTVKPNWLLTGSLILFAFNLHAQVNTTDSTLQDIQASKATGFYNQGIAGQSELYNGTAYEPLPKAYKGSVYFLQINYFTPCIIRYNGTVYKNVPVLYDVFSDLMVAASPDQFNYILKTKKLSDIFIVNHHFVYIDDENNDVLKSGYYDQLYAGQMAVLVKRSKLVSNSVSQQGVEVAYQDNSEIYIKKNKSYFQIYSRASLMNILKDKEKELDQYLKKNKLKYNKDKEAYVTTLVKYYDQITN